MSIDEFTPEELKIQQAFTRFEEENNLGFDNFLDIMAKQMLLLANKETHDGVKGCLIGCANFLREASFALYASTK